MRRFLALLLVLGMLLLLTACGKTKNGPPVGTSIRASMAEAQQTPEPEGKSPGLSYRISEKMSNTPVEESAPESGRTLVPALVPATTVEKDQAPEPTPEPAAAELAAGYYAIRSAGSYSDESFLNLYDSGVGLFTMVSSGNYRFDGVAWQPDAMEIESAAVDYFFDGSTLSFSYEGETFEAEYQGVNDAYVLGVQDHIDLSGNYVSARGYTASFSSDGTGTLTKGEETQPAYWGRVFFGDGRAMTMVILGSVMNGVDFLNEGQRVFSFSVSDGQDVSFSPGEPREVEGEEYVLTSQLCSIAVTLCRDDWDCEQSDAGITFHNADRTASISMSSGATSDASSLPVLGAALDSMNLQLAQPYDAQGTLSFWSTDDCTVNGCMGKTTGFSLNEIDLQSRQYIWSDGSTAFLMNVTGLGDAYDEALAVAEALQASFRYD